jgi:hypothetical protein
MNDFEALIADAWIVVLGLSHSWNLLSAMLFEDLFACLDELDWK